jgi:hypothetical protein
VIYIPDRTIVKPFIHLNVGMKGMLRIQVWRPDDVLHRCRIDTGWFPNKILDNGRNNMATQASWLTHCHVGTDSTPPSASDTQLLGFVVATNTVVETTSGAQPSSPYYGWLRKTYRFAQGAGHGGQNLSEAGIGWGDSGSTLISRALIVDPITQLPTTVTPLADEILDVTYELQYHPPAGDTANTISLAGTTYDTTTRAALVTSDIWKDHIGTAIGAYAPTTGSWAAYDGDLGSVTQNPNGLSAGIDFTANVTNQAYSNNSYQIVMQALCGPNGWNLGSYAQCIAFYTKAGAYQTKFESDPGLNPVPKTTSYTWDMEWILSWTEKV